MRCMEWYINNQLHITKQVIYDVIILWCGLKELEDLNKFDRIEDRFVLKVCFILCDFCYSHWVCVFVLRIFMVRARLCEHYNRPRPSYSPLSPTGAFIERSKSKKPAITSHYRYTTPQRQVMEMTCYWKAYDFPTSLGKRFAFTTLPHHHNHITYLEEGKTISSRVQCWADNSAISRCKKSASKTSVSLD